MLIPVFGKVVAERRAYFASSFGDGLQALEQAEGFFSASGESGSPGGRPPAPTLAPDGNEPFGLRGMINAAVLRSMLAGLLIAVVLSLLAAVVTAQRAMLAVNIALVDCLLVFVALLVVRRDARVRRNGTERAVAPSRGPAAVYADASPPRRLHTPGVPVISAPVVGALASSVAHPA